MSKASRSKRRAERANERTRRSGGKEGKPRKGPLREWIDALVFAVVVMIIVRTLFFDLFRIPTPSMEKNLLVGDYIFVSKLNYGTRTPITLGIPFTGIHLPGLVLPNTRLPGFGQVERGDVVVFNWPEEADKPVDRREHYIKRVVGLPGDTLSLVDNVVHVKGETLPLGEGMQQAWFVEKTSEHVALPSAMLRELGVNEIVQTRNRAIVRITATAPVAQEIATLSYVRSVNPVEPDPTVYDSAMFVKGRMWTPHDFGPVPVPAKDQTVTLTAENWPYYETVITRHEGHEARMLADSSFVIDGQAATTYTFGQDYFFMMGDNRDNSEDSRFWGYVPMDHLVGKAIFLYFSWDSERTLPRFSRIFSGVR